MIEDTSAPLRSPITKCSLNATIIMKLLCIFLAHGFVILLQYIPIYEL